MSLDARFHIIYGYKVNGTKLIDDILKYSSEDKNWILPNGIDYDTFEDELINGNDLCLVEDTMCGNYCYLGLPIINEYDEYSVPYEFEFDPMYIPRHCDDEKLDELIKEKIPFIVGNEYDEAGLLYGELPKVYIFKNIW